MHHLPFVGNFLNEAGTHIVAVVADVVAGVVETDA